MADHVVIIGGGPGGYEAAHVAAQLGAEVTLVDSDGVGGSAVLTDCVPSKTLIATAEVMTELSEASELGVRFEDPEGDEATTISVDLARVNQRVKQLATDQSTDIAARLERDGVTGAPGRGGLAVPTGSWSPRAGGGRLRADAVLVATGAAPRTLPDAQPDGERILTWEQVYDLTEVPSELVVVGLRRHRRRVRLGVPRPRHPGHAGLLARPGAARRGRRRRRRARGGPDPPGDERALEVPDGVGDPGRRRRHGHPHRRPQRAGLPLHPGARVGPQHRRPRARGGRSRHRRRRLHPGRSRLAHVVPRRARAGDGSSRALCGSASAARAR